MAESSVTLFPLPPNFNDSPTEAAFPRQLIIYDNDSDSWNSTVQKDVIAHTRYLCVSYRQSDFPTDVWSQLELDVQAVCQHYDLPAYWLDYACTGSTQEEKNRDLYRIADVFRGATKTLIMIKGSDDKPHSPGWISWGDRLWTLPEALLSGYSGDKLVYRVGRRKVKPITLREIANHAYRDGDREMTLMNVYSGEPVIGSDAMFEVLVKTIWGRSSGSEKGEDKVGVFTAYEAEKVYALMGFMAKRIIPDPEESEQEAFMRLMKENGLDKDLESILNSSDARLSPHAQKTAQLDLEQMKVLDKIPYTGGMRYDTGKRCLKDTRLLILERIKHCIDNSDGAYDDKRVFLLTGVAGSGKSTIAHSIASHYDDKGQLGSSFFFYEADKEGSQPHNLFRNIARDLADNNKHFRSKICDIVANNTALSTTRSIQEQFQKFIDGVMRDIALERPVVIVIDALDECSKGGNSRTELLNILAKELSDAPLNFRVFVTARPVGDISVFESSRYVEFFTMDKIDSTRGDIRAFLQHELSHVANELSTVSQKWLTELTDMAGNLFIYADIACRYILEKDVRRPKEKLRNILSLQQESEVDLNSPTPYLYTLYTKVLKDIAGVEALSPNNLKSVQERLIRVLGMVLLAYEPLSSSDIDELIGANDNAEGIIGQMGTLLNGVSSPKLDLLPVRLLHASFGDFLRDEKLNKAFYVNPQKLHREMAKSCLEMLNKCLKFNIFGFGDVFTSYFISRYDMEDRITRISKALRYSCLYWPIHLTQMSKNDFKLVQMPLQKFLFEEKRLIHWIEVTSAISQWSEAESVLLSLYHWLKEVNPDDERIPQLIWECYHLLRCFQEPINSGPLQVYISALPYAPLNSLLHKLYGYQTILLNQPNILFESVQDIRLLSSPLRGWSTAAFSHDGTRFVSISKVGMQVFDFSTFSPINEPIELHSQYDLITFSPDGYKVVVAGAGILEVWSLTERRALIRESIAGVKIKAVAFSSNSRVFCCILQGGNVELLDMNLSPRRTGKDTKCFHIEESLICVAMSPNASHVCGISQSNKLSVWDARDSTAVVYSVDLGNTGTEGTFDALSMSCDGDYIVCGSSKGIVKLWNSRSASFEWSKKIDSGIKQILIPFRLGNKQFVTVPEEGHICVFDMLTGSCKHEMMRKIAAVVSPDGRHIVTQRGEVSLIETNNDEPGTKRAVLIRDEILEEVVILEDGSLIVVGKEATSGNIVLWYNFRLGPASWEASRQILEVHTSDTDLKPIILFLRFSPDGRGIILISRNWRAADDKWATGTYNILLWCQDGNLNDARFSLREKHTFDRENFELMDAVLLADGSILVAARSGDGKVIVLWDNYESEVELAEQIMEAHTAYINGVRLSPNGRRLVSWTYAKVLLWSREDVGTNFTLQEEHENRWTRIKSDDNVEQLTYSWFSEISPKGSEIQNSSSFEQVHGSDAFFEFEQENDFYGKRDYVCLADGRRLWYIPDGFLGRRRMTQRGHKAVVYGPRFAILFEYKDDVIGTISNSTE